MVEPFRAAKRRLDYQGILPKEQMPRLAEATLAVNRDADAWIRFEVDSQGLTVMTGKATTEVVLECQRCGGPIGQTLEVEFQYTPVIDHQQTDEIPDAYELLELDENGAFRLHELLEDEFLLALPLIAKHSLEECNIHDELQMFGEIAAGEDQQQRNPFAILQNLKKDN